MNRFQALLKPTETSTPKEDQDRASQGLANAVAASHLRWWLKGGARPASGRYLLLAVAPYSQYDLALLDLIDEGIHSDTRARPTVYVIDLLAYENQEEMKGDFPNVSQVFQTPIVTFGEVGQPNISASGQEGRELAAQVLGLSAEGLTANMLARSPRYNGSPLNGV
jgi:hypothetical protein